MRKLVIVDGACGRHYCAVEETWYQTLVDYCVDRQATVTVELEDMESNLRPQCSPMTPTLWLPMDWYVLDSYFPDHLRANLDLENQGPAANGLQPDELEIQRHLMVSSSHLPFTLRLFLDGQARESWKTSPHLVMRVPTLIVDPIGAFGWRVCLDGDLIHNWLSKNSVEEPLSALIRLGLNNGCQWLAIDADGPVLHFLPTYEDEEKIDAPN